MTDWNARKDNDDRQVPMVGFAAYSGTGKTTLLIKLIPLLKEKGWRVAALKHAHHDFDIDKPGKDSYELRAAGADEMVIISDKRMAKVVELAEPLDFYQSLSHINMAEVDIVLVEGFKKEPIKKIELTRHSLQTENRPFLHLKDENIIAIACDDIKAIETKVSNKLPRLDLNNPASIVDYIENNLSKFLVKKHKS